MATQAAVTVPHAPQTANRVRQVLVLAFLLTGGRRRCAGSLAGGQLSCPDVLLALLLYFLHHVHPWPIVDSSSLRLYRGQQARHVGLVYTVFNFSVVVLLAFVLTGAGSCWEHTSSEGNACQQEQQQGNAAHGLHVR